MLRKSRWAWLMAVVVVFGLVAVACGDDKKSSDTTAKETTTTAKGPAAPSDSSIKGLTAKLAAGGASFPDAFYQAVNADFNKVAGQELVTYAKSGSLDGRQKLAAGSFNFAGSDSLPKPEENLTGVLFFPTVAAPITVSYKVSGLTKLQLSPDTIAKIFQAQITQWDDAAIKADNPGATLPATKITVVHRSDGSGTTSNFTKYLKSAAPSTWKLDSGDTVSWPAGTQGAEKNSGVAAVIGQTDGAVGYVDVADAKKANLSVASIKNSEGKFVAPSADGASSALANAKVNPDLTYNPLNAPGAATYPITAPTYIIVKPAQTDAGVATSLRTYLQYVLTTGQAQALQTGYVGLPTDLQQKAFDQVAKITG